jgi:basic amino acid/polyamine antiporter, APA family
LKELERTLGPFAVIAVSMSAMLGSGIFVLPGLAAAKTGPSVWLAYVLAGVCVFPAAACKAELATAMPMSGGTYVYVDRIFGPLAGTVAGVALWLSMLLKSAFALVGFSTYLIALGDIPVKPTASLLLLGIIGLNVLGVKKVGRAQVAVIGVTTAALIALSLAGLLDTHRENLQHELSHGVGGLLAAMAFVFVSYNGVTKVAAIAEEVKNPERNIPIGILGSLACVLGLYALVTLTLVAVVPYAELSTDLHPIYTLAARIGGRWLGVAAAVVGVATMTSMANAGLLAASRFPFAMARDKLLPDLLREVHRSLRTPVPAILITGAAMLVALWLLDVERLAKIASGLVIMLYVTENLAVVAFRESRVQWYQPKYRSPFYPWLHAFGVVSGLVLLIALGPLVWFGAMLVAAPGLVLFLGYGRRRVVRVGVVGQRVRRAELLKEPESRPEEFKIEGAASVVVALFGKEHSPEMLLELAGALAGDQKVQVLHLTEVPEQTLLEAALEEDVSVRALRRRANALAEERKLDLEFHSVLSRDIGQAVLSASSRTSCKWVVMEWHGRERHMLLPYNPVGWLINNLDANLAVYKDAGVRYVREILVYAEPGPHDALVVDTADHLARLWGASLTLVRFVRDGAPPTELQAQLDYLGQVKRLCKAPARELIVRGTERIRELSAVTAAYDLMVMGAPDVTLLRQLRGTDQDRIKARAGCSVLTVRTPRARTHEAFARAGEEAERPCRLPDYLAPGALGARLPISKKDQLFSHFATVFGEALADVPARLVSDALWERESTQNTSVGHGVALPHATLIEAKRAAVGVFTTETPIDYSGPDDQPVDVFFVTICPPAERETHLRLLSRIAALSLSTDLLERLRAAEDEDELRVAIEESTRAIEKGRAR